jgi:hypothetical protein
VREAVLHERVSRERPDVTPEALIVVLERLAAAGRLHVTVEHDLPARDPAPFAARYWRLTAS